MNKKVLIIVIILIVVIAVLVVYYLYYGREALEKKGIVPTLPELGDLGASIDVGEGAANPLEDMPSTNPFEEVVNPFRDSYKNPFE